MVMRSGEVMVVRDGFFADMMEVFHGVMEAAGFKCWAPGYAMRSKVGEAWRGMEGGRRTGEAR